jgi:two-component system alkaline phosphatase synthesis response regulator PhoP
MARVLVAEDEESLSKLVRVNLEDEGHDVVVAEDGRYALKALMEEKFDVVVLDLMMPFTDGFEVLKNLGKNRPKVILLTARSDAYTHQRAEKYEVDAYIEKPYDPMKLAEKVRELSGG